MKRVFAALAGKVRRMTAPFRERPTMKVDDHVMEHFLLYNGLIGTSPEKDRDYKDVRNDVVQAVNDNSGHLMAIALKLQPLLWEERLEKIFAEIAQINKQGAINCLLAVRPDDDIIGDTTPLSHSDWRVRSNAARMLAFLEVKESVPRLIEILQSSNKEQAAAFCHISHSLARLGTESARQALVAEIANDEHWFRVDVASSLAHWQLSSVVQDLMRLMSAGSEFDDYMAVAISRKHKPASFAEYHDDDIHEGLAELSMSLLKAIEGPFHAEHAINDQLEEICSTLIQNANNKPSARRIAAAIAVNRYLHEKGRKTQLELRDLSNKTHYEAVKRTLSESKYDSPTKTRDFRHALALAGTFKLTELSPLMVPLLKDDFPLLPELVDSLANIGDQAAAERIVELIEKQVKLNQRCQMAFSAHPVIEEDARASNFYWTALKSLGSLPHPAALKLLERAVNDYAPDKREQALLSLQTILLSEELRKKHYKGNLESLIQERMEDPAAAVQAAALIGVAQHKMTSLLPDLVRALNSRETIVQRQALESCVNLANNGHRNDVKAALEAAITKEHDSSRKFRMNKALQRIQAI